VEKGSISPSFLPEQDVKLLLANRIWRMAQNIAKIQHSYFAKFSSFKDGETEWIIFCLAICAGNFCLV